jgi:hypothetical protein
MNDERGLQGLGHQRPHTLPWQAIGIETYVNGNSEQSFQMHLYFDLISRRTQDLARMLRRLHDHPARQPPPQQEYNQQLLG